MLVVMMTILALVPHMSSAMEQDSSEEPVEMVEVQYNSLFPEGSGDNEHLEDGEIVLYACIAVTCPLLLMFGTGLYKKRKVDNINYW